MIDGIVLHHIATSLKEVLLGGRVDKITQPEKDELIIHIRAGGQKRRLLLSAQATMPRVHLTYKNKKNPQTPPSYCMLLRKYIGNARITDIQQLSMERILKITLEQLNEMGDLCSYGLIIEIMGKHSNIILVDQENNILDSIKRIGANISSVRQVYPGKEYQLPPKQGKIDIRTLSSIDEMRNQLLGMNDLVYKSIYMKYLGISPFVANNICFSAGIDGNSHVESLSSPEFALLYESIDKLIHMIDKKAFTPYLITDQTGNYEDYHSLLLTEDLFSKKVIPQEDINLLIDSFYETRSLQVRMKQKTHDMRKLIQTSLERAYKKLDIQSRQLKDTENMDKFKIKGELLLANQYLIKDGDQSVEVLNYYTNQQEKISLDPNKSAIENANKAFDKYNKKKRTLVAVKEQIEKTESEIGYLESVKYSVENVKTEEEIEDIRHELMETGYIRYRKTKSKQKLKSKPYHYISSDGFHMYVGKNNLQNDELSTKFASNSDWWFHTKEVPGSHVIVKCQGQELPDNVYEEAAALAAYYSKARMSTKVTVDYTMKKHLKKPHGSAPGYVIYHTNYSLFIDPSIDHLTLVD